MIKYKGLTAKVEYDKVDRIYIGRVTDIDTIITFHGKTLDEMKKAFREAVEHFLDVSDRAEAP